jgi:GT2 family glycosyltransferase
VSEAPLVSVLIAAYNRPDELRLTLRALREQDYSPLEVLVVDDASPTDLGPVVHAEWPGARFWRNAENRGPSANRSIMMREARGTFMLGLDDDSNLVAPDAIRRAVARFEREPRMGAIACLVHEGPTVPAAVAAPAPESCVASFIACGHFLRTAAVREVGGYREFFNYYGEEGEYALRLLDAGWHLKLCPDLLVHHRMSAIGRSSGRIAAHGFRNTLWSMVMNVPAPRVLGEAAWKFVSHTIEMLRIGQPRWWAWAIGSFVRGLPRAIRLRRPISRRTMRAFDVLRFRTVLTADALWSARPPSPRERLVWFWRVWRRRRRARPFWDSRADALGESNMVSTDGVTS